MREVHTATAGSVTPASSIRAASYRSSSRCLRPVKYGAERIGGVSGGFKTVL